ncbi:DsbA family oxidoreductase [Evansella tamaricis]|uniref:DsbA family oxidoreductase n=1 Tax=Evansella tamaricis TaxID=2069301 RepID=A0ABS6JB28_9BACI|nr:DsbA family oxidoreductase [Evansella tamaricis]MBU9710718.1 DsbA family oxidoreductase [Evansella tamaricis]
MKIEVWSDFACPFCYIGKRRLEQAMEHFPHRQEVQIIFRSFQLDPYAKVNNSEDLYDVLASKYGMSREKARQMSNQVKEQAKEVGLDFQFDTAVHTNTGDAHRLAHYSYEHGKGLEMTERLLKAYFTDSLHLGEHEVLSDLAVEVGLSREGVQRMLTKGDYQSEVKMDQENGSKLGVRGVPFFVFDEKYAISGAQPYAVFKETLEKAWEEKQKIEFVNPDDTISNQCSDNSCDS